MENMKRRKFRNIKTLHYSSVSKTIRYVKIQNSIYNLLLYRISTNVRYRAFISQTGAAIIIKVVFWYTKVDMRYEVRPVIASPEEKLRR